MIKIYRTLILPVVRYGCETWSLTLREERVLRVFENRFLEWEPEGKRPRGRPWRRWEDDDKVDPREVGVWTGSSWLRIWTGGWHL